MVSSPFGQRPCLGPLGYQHSGRPPLGGVFVGHGLPIDGRYVGNLDSLVEGH